MEYIPRYLARKFSFFESISMPKFFLLFFGTFFITAIISTYLGEGVANIIMPIVGVLIFIAYAGFVSAQHFSVPKKPWIPSSPLIVQFTSRAWFNSIISLLSLIRHWGVLVFVNLVVVIVVFIIVAALTQQLSS